MRIKKTLAGAALAGLALTALAACGDDSSDGDGSSGGDAPKAADIRVWLNGTDTPDEARQWLKKTFEEQNPGSTLTIEQQEWDGLVEKLTTALSSESETPDVVEIGNTQAPTFTSAGAFSDLTGQLDSLGGDDLLQGFVDGATVDGNYGFGDGCFDGGGFDVAGLFCAPSLEPFYARSGWSTCPGGTVEDGAGGPSPDLRMMRFLSPAGRAAERRLREEPLTVGWCW